MNQTIIELLVTALIVCTQCGIFWFSLKKVQELKRFFPGHKTQDYVLETATVENESVQVIKIDDAFAKKFEDLLISINNYLKKNKGLTEFGIIKNMIDRRVESLDNEVTSNISLPLYIGLMGTFLGIIIGLKNIAFSGGVSEQNVNLFLGGVVTAMIGSLTGLGLTVINNSITLKIAQKDCDKRKNIFYDFLQVELLPHLQNGLFDALDRLKGNINNFNGKFEKNIELFDEKFTENINSLKGSVTLLSDNIGEVVKNTLVQQEFLAELKRIGYDEMATANLRVFKLLNSALPTMNIFIEKQNELTVSVEHAATFVNVIDRILDRIKTFEDSLNGLGEKINAPQYLGNEVLQRIDKNLSYLDEQYETLKQHEVISSERIKEFFHNQYGTIERLTDDIKREVEEALTINIKDNPFQKLNLLNAIEESLKMINNKIAELDSRLKEEPFKKLELIESVEQTLKLINENVDFNLFSKELQANSDRIDSSIKEIGKKLDAANDAKRNRPVESSSSDSAGPAAKPITVNEPYSPKDKIDKSPVTKSPNNIKVAKNSDDTVQINHQILEKDKEVNDLDSQRVRAVEENLLPEKTNPVEEMKSDEQISKKKRNWFRIFFRNPFK